MIEQQHDEQLHSTAECCCLLHHYAINETVYSLQYKSVSRFKKGVTKNSNSFSHAKRQDNTDA